MVGNTNRRNSFIQLYCNFYVENLLDELKEYINKSNVMQYKKYLTKLRNLSYNEIMKDEEGKKICDNTIKKYEKIVKAEKVNEIINLKIDLHYYIGIMNENNLNNSFILFTKLMKSICFSYPPVLLHFYNNKDEIFETITYDENNNDNDNSNNNNTENNNIKEEKEEEESEENEESEGEEEEEETEDESDEEKDIKLKHYSPLSIPIPNKRKSIYDPINLEEEKMKIKIRKIDPVTKELQIQSSNIHRLDEPHDSAEEVKWDDQNTPPSSYNKNKNNNKNNILFPSSNKIVKKVKIEKKDKQTVYQNGRVRFTQKEVQNLLEGVKRFGVGKWKEILGCYEFNEKRTTVDLKDKYRNIQKNRSYR